MLFLNTALEGLRLGLCYAVLAMALYVSYTILDFPDLSVEGNFPLGGVIGTIALYRLGLPPLLAVLLSFLSGALCGALMGLLHVKCRISKLLSGIIVMTGLISVTLALTQLLSRGLTVVYFNYIPNGVRGFFNAPFTAGFSSSAKTLYGVAVLLVFALAVKLLLDLFFATKAGFLLRAAGGNEQTVRTLGQDPGRIKMLGLMLSGGLVGVSGCLYAQMRLQYDNTSGAGKVVIALVAVIMGLSLFGRIPRVRPTTAVALGAILYSLALCFFTLIDRGGIYLKLFNAAFFAAVLILGENRLKFHTGWLKTLFSGKKRGGEKEETTDA